MSLKCYRLTHGFVDIEDILVFLVAGGSPSTLKLDAQPWLTEEMAAMLHKAD